MLSIQSHVVRGYVGNRAATFPLQVRLRNPRGPASRRADRGGWPPPARVTLAGPRPARSAWWVPAGRPAPGRRVRRKPPCSPRAPAGSHPFPLPDPSRRVLCGRGDAAPWPGPCPRANETGWAGVCSAHLPGAVFCPCPLWVRLPGQRRRRKLTVRPRQLGCPSPHVGPHPAAGHSGRWSLEREGSTCWCWL